MLIRKAEHADRDAMASLHAASIRALCAGHYDAAAIDAWTGLLRPSVYDQALEAKVVVVAEEDGELLGLGMLDADAAMLSAVYVAPACAGRGVGSALLAELERVARERSLGTLTTQATLNSQGFYARHGYGRVRDTEHALPTGAVLPCVEMVKRFDAPE